MFSRSQKLKWKYWYPISVEIEHQQKKLCKFLNRAYLYVWPYILGFWILVCVTWGVLQFRHDYNLLENYAHIDSLTSDYYTSWRTDGHPGQEPPKK
jgi:hypothetical protein